MITAIEATKLLEEANTEKQNQIKLFIERKMEKIEKLILESCSRISNKATVVLMKVDLPESFSSVSEMKSIATQIVEQLKDAGFYTTTKEITKDNGYSPKDAGPSMVVGIEFIISWSMSNTTGAVGYEETV